MARRYVYHESVSALLLDKAEVRALEGRIVGVGRGVSQPHSSRAEALTCNNLRKNYS
jgi:hypothetical protein